MLPREGGSSSTKAIPRIAAHCSASSPSVSSGHAPGPGPASAPVRSTGLMHAPPALAMPSMMIARVHCMWTSERVSRRQTSGDEKNRVGPRSALVQRERRRRVDDVLALDGADQLERVGLALGGAV